MNYTIIFIVSVIVLFILVINKEEPTQSEIQSLTHAKKQSPDYVFPQISHGFKQLSKGIVKPLDTLNDLLPNNTDSVQMIREVDTPSTMTKQRVYLPDYYRKDRLSQNDIHLEEMRPFVTDEKIVEDAWTDKNVSEHPKYYTSDIKDELTNSGSFFNKNNQFNDKTSDNTDVLPSDNCYVNKNGDSFCADSTRLQNIPPALITDPDGNYALNYVGIYKDREKKDNTHERVMNGSLFYNDVKASRGINETYAKPLEVMTGEFIYT